MANIQKRGEYQYQVDIRRRGYPRQIETFETKAQAERWAREQESKMDQGLFRDLRVVAGTTLSDALDRYMAEVVPTNAEGGQRQERNRIRRLKEHPLARRLLTTLQASDFAKFRNERVDQVGSTNTVRLELALLSHLYTIGKKEWGWPLDNPFKDVKRPSPPDGRERRLIGDEELRLLGSAASAEDVQKPIWLVACIRLALATGMRAGELLSLGWDQLDLVNGVASLTKARNGSKRSVGLNLEAVRVLQGLPRQGERVIPGYYETGKLDGDFKAAREDAGIVDLVFHDLRHEAASRFAPHMMPQELAKIMGWKTLQMAMRYYNPSAQELAAKMREVEAVRTGLPALAVESASAPEAGQLQAASEPQHGEASLATSPPDNVIRVEFSRHRGAAAIAVRSV